MCIPSKGVFAHVLITDETKTKGAVLHIIPDDDPVAGEEAALYLDTQEKLSDAGNSVTLSITEASGNQENVETKVDGTLATANYTFPTQGVYDLQFTVVSAGNTYIFKQSQRISNGITDNPLNRQTYVWAEILLITSGIGFALLVIMAINHRRELAKSSIF